MLVSELVRRTSVPLATVKYYLREGLLAPGRKTTARVAEYDETHVRRLNLLRLLRSVGDIPVTKLRNLVDATEDTTLSVHQMFARATDALAPAPPPLTDRDSRALADRVLAEAGWDSVRDEAVDRDNLAAVLEAITAWMPGLDATRAANAYVRLADDLARGEIASLRDDGDRADLLEQMVVGTVLFERLLTVLRRLAEEQHSAQRFSERY
ncbi:MAG TPA: MerR family transcriptional regulator [Nocardioidaceae bacterium]|nr:MerR family transcriptional regulator [Nocardioidaceae bacterium]